MDSYLKYKAKYLNLKKSIVSKKQTGGRYKFNRVGRCHVSYQNDHFIFILTRLPATQTEAPPLCYREGYLVFIGTAPRGYLLTVSEFFDYTRTKNIEINIAFLEFYKWFVTNVHSDFFETFFTYIFKGDGAVPANCIGLNHCMYFNLFTSTYTRDCNIQKPWQTMGALCNALVNGQPAGGYKWRCTNYYLEDIKKTIFTKFKAEGNGDEMYVINFPAETEHKERNNYCNFPMFIHWNCADPSHNCNPGTGQVDKVVHDTKCYLTPHSTKFRYIMQINYAYATFSENTTWAFFRGQTIPYMHFKIKADINLRYYREVFQRTPLDYYNTYVYPKLHVTGGADTTTIESNGEITQSQSRRPSIQALSNPPLESSGEITQSQSRRPSIQTLSDPPFEVEVEETISIPPLEREVDEYDNIRDKLIMDIDALTNNIYDATTIYGLLESYTLDKVAIKSNYENMLDKFIALAEQYLNTKKEVYVNGQELLDQLIIELPTINNIALRDIKNNALYRRITSTNIQIIEGIAEHEFSVEEINIIKNLVKKYYPDCEILI